MATKYTGPLYYTTTNSDIDTEEITRTLDRGQGILKKMALEAGYANLYSMRDCGECDRLLLYLRLYAIESWDNADGAINYFEIGDMRRLLTGVQEYFGTCS